MIKPTNVCKTVTDYVYSCEDGVCADFCISKEYEGHKGFAHGGIVALLLDEVMSYAVVTQKITNSVTQRLRITYIAPVRIGVRYTLQAQMDSYNEGSGIVSGKVIDNIGNTKVIASGVFRFFDNTVESCLGIEACVIQR